MGDAMIRDLLEEISERLDEFDRGSVPTSPDLNTLGRELAGVLRAPVYPEPDRDYVVSDSFAVYYSADGQALLWSADEPISTPAFVVHNLLSWSGPYALIDWKRTQDARTWLPQTEEELPSSLRAVSEKLQRFLNEAGYKVLSGPILDQFIPGRTSELDDSPQTVREGLFSAID